MGFFEDDLQGEPTLLENWTPDVGTSWTALHKSGPRSMQVIASGVRFDGHGGNLGVIYTADATYPSADYSVQMTLVDVFGDEFPVYMFARVQDVDNLYAVRLRDTAGSCQLYKKVGGTWTALGSAFDPPANGSVVKLEVSGSSITFYDDGVEVASATDSEITAAGKAGIGGGGGAELVEATDDVRAIVMLHTFSVTELAGGGGGTAHEFAAAIAGTSATPDVTALAVARPLQTTIGAASATPDGAVLAVAREVAAAIAGVTLTPAVELAMNRPLAAILAGSSAAPDDVALGVARALAAVVGGASAAADDVTLSISGLVELAAVIAGASATPDAAVLAVSRQLASTMGGTSATPDDVVLANLLALAATVSGASATPDVAALAVVRSFSAAIAAQSLTPEVSLTLSILLMAQIMGQSETNDSATLLVGGELGDSQFKATFRGLFRKMR